MPVADPHRLILTGENPFLRMSDKDGDPNSTDASYWRILFSPGGPGHVLYLKSELTENLWRIYSDNIAMARWLQATVQGMLNSELKDLTIPVTDAEFEKSGDPRYFWNERIQSFDEEVLLTGSANLDHRSFRHNLEVAVNVRDHDAARAALSANFGGVRCPMTITTVEGYSHPEKLVEIEVTVDLRTA